MRRLRSSAGRVGLPLAIALAACTPDSAGDRAPDAATADSGAAAETVLPDASTTSTAYRTIDVVDGAVLRGRVRFSGQVPAPDTLRITADTAICGTSRVRSRVKVGGGTGLADAVVSLTDIEAGKPWPDAAASPPTLDQHECRFTPHVVLARVGDTVRVLNSDPFSHNVHTAGFDNRSVNRTQPAGASPITLAFAAPEKVRVKCDLHPWMSAWIVVADHPYHAVTGEAGRFTMPGVPPGTYTLEVWHEALGTRSRTVTLEPGQTLDVDFDFATGD